MAWLSRVARPFDMALPHPRALCREAPAVLRSIGADAVVADQMDPAAAIVAERLALPYVSVACALPLETEPALPDPVLSWPYNPSPAGVRRHAWGRRTLLGWSLLHFLWQGAVIGAAGALVLRLLRSSAPSIRYLVACGTLALMVAAPVHTALGATGLPAVFAPAVTAPVAPDARNAPVAGSAVVAPSAGWHGAVAPGQILENGRLLTLLVMLWAGGVGLMSLRLAVGWRRVRRIHRRALRAQLSPWTAASRRVANRLGLRRAVTVVECADQTVPMLVGWMRPVIILPAACVAGLSPRQVEAILAHELAHVHRHDLVVNLLQSIAELLLFYHPAVWWISARIREEREYCCDDAAVQACGEPREYVDALVRLEIARRSPARVFVAAATDGPLVARARRLLAPGDVPRGQFAGILPVLLLGILIAGALARATSSDSSAFTLPEKGGSVAEAALATTAPTRGRSQVAASQAAPVVASSSSHDRVPDAPTASSSPVPTAVVPPKVPAREEGAPGVIAGGVPEGMPRGISGRVVDDTTRGAPGGPRDGAVPGVSGNVAGDNGDGARGDAQDARPAAAPASHARIDALLFELSSLAPDALHASRLAALQFIDAQMAEGDWMTILSVADGLDVVADLTSDRDTLRAALLALEPGAAPSAASTTGAPARRWLAPLRTVCESLGPVQGRKRLLLFKSGGAGEATDAGELRDTLSACQRASVAVYPVDARGLSTVPDSAGSPDLSNSTEPSQ